MARVNMFADKLDRINKSLSNIHAFRKEVDNATLAISQLLNKKESFTNLSKFLKVERSTLSRWYKNKTYPSSNKYNVLVVIHLLSDYYEEYKHIKSDYDKKISDLRTRLNEQLAKYNRSV